MIYLFFGLVGLMRFDYNFGESVPASYKFIQMADSNGIVASISHVKCRCVDDKQCFRIKAANIKSFYLTFAFKMLLNKL